MGRIVIVAYRPKSGREADLEALVRAHVPKLQALGLATQRTPVVMRAADGTTVEVFEWSSPGAIEQAHANAEVQAMWADFAEACDYLPIAEVPEAARLFSEFEALD
ncbi:MAG: hypothetical protein V2I66_14260 [Halieaceae bacterium]|nr:hypothetical protein [Halieaceae bacterium]